MKVIIDLIEDIRTAIDNDQNFTLAAMGFLQKDDAEFVPTWQSNIVHMEVDEINKRLCFLLGKEESFDIGTLVEELNALPNEAMMHEVFVSYSKDKKRIDSPLIGFGESFQDKKYFLFVDEMTRD